MSTSASASAGPGFGSGSGCGYFDAGRCRSCGELPASYAEQLRAKEQRAAAALPADVVWLPPVTSAPWGFRNKAKMVVAGSVDAPTLGILDGAGHGVDLQGCPLYSDAVHALFPLLSAFVTRAGLEPYDVPARRGELKHLIVTESPTGKVMVRFVVRSDAAVARVREHLGWLLEQAPQVRVVSANLLPEHKAVLEGDVEQVLTREDTLELPVNGLRLRLRPRSFFQTNTEVAAALYRQATAWVLEAAPASVLDLYCGVGGFALHAAAAGVASVRGVEMSAEAVAGARATARAAGLDVDFRCGDVSVTAGVGGHLVDPGSADPGRKRDLLPQTSLTDDRDLLARELRDAELVIVNPPRRGLGSELCARLEAAPATTLVYSSCHLDSLARDLAALPSWRLERAQVLDMFPHTRHFELLTLLRRR